MNRKKENDKSVSCRPFTLPCVSSKSNAALIKLEARQQEQRQWRISKRRDREQENNAAGAEERDRVRDRQFTSRKLKEASESLERDFNSKQEESVENAWCTAVPDIVRPLQFDHFGEKC